MPKSKKKKNADFQKIKLKVGKKLPRGLNETDLSFKTRQLQMPKTKDFLKTDEPQTRRKLTLDELIKQCDANKSASLRLSSLEGFKELLLSDTGRAAVLSNLHQVMVRVSSLISDQEPTVRQAVLRLCKTVLSLIDVSTKRSFFDYLSAQLCCAMNHISDNVRRDAMVLFDMLLEKFPLYLTDEYCQLVPHLVDQVSGQVSVGKTGNSEKSKASFFNPDSKLLSKQWRTETLARLKNIVDIFVGKHKTELKEQIVDEGEFYHVKDLPLIRGPTVPTHIRETWTALPKARSLTSQRQQYSQLHRSADNLQHFISGILPLLKQCWIEEHLSEETGNARQKYNEEGQNLRQESLPMVQAIVGLLHSVVECWRCVHQHSSKQHQDENCWFRGEFLKQLREMFLPHFPIAVALKAQKDKKAQSASQAALEVSVLKLNLQVCEALASFPPSDIAWPRVSVPLEKWHKVIVVFLLKNLKLCSGAELGSQASSVLRCIFLNFPCSAKQEKLLQRAQERFVKAHPLSTEKRVYLGLFKELAFDLDCASPYNIVFKERHALLQPFFESLPGLLLQLCGLGGGHDCVKLLLKVLSCPRISPLLAQAMDAHMVQLLDCESGVFAKLPSSCHVDFVQAVKCIYRKMPASQDVLHKVETVCRLSNISDDTAERLFTGLHQEFCNMLVTGKFEESCQHYLRFFFSVLVGHSKEELESLHQGTTKTGLFNIAWITDAQQMKRHRVLVKHCVGCFGAAFHAASSQPFATILASTWSSSILTKYNTLEALTTYGALMHWYQMMSPLREGEILHINDETSPWTDSNGPEIWAQLVSELLPVVKENLRPFSRLTFSVVYSMVSMETDEGVVTGDAAAVTVMWEAVTAVMQRSLRVFLDLCQLAADFVQSERSEKEVQKVSQVLTKLLSTEALSDHRDRYSVHVKNAMQLFSSTTQNWVPSAVEQPWWQDFTGAWL